MTSSIVQIAIDCPLRTLFDYLNPFPGEPLQPGVRVKVPFGKRETVGIVMHNTHITAVPVHKLRALIAVLDTAPLLPPPLLALARFASGYYHQPIGEVLFSILPILLRKGKPAIIQHLATAAPQPRHEKPILLNPAQKNAIEAVGDHFETFLLYGVTGSGKTEVYLQLIDRVLTAGKQALVLVPEIGLTPQTVERFRARFSVPIVIVHSGLTDKKRLQHWLMAQTGEAHIIIGTRSALFTPLVNPGILIIDEEHDLSFKQQ
ncbi:MAG: DEAD/DEAH box helicase, partial [Gammaproteobacteria bacterium]